MYLVRRGLFNIFSVSDRITILRDGEIVDTKNIDEITPTELIAKMVGRRIEKLFDYSENILGEEQLRVEHLTRKGKFEDVSFSIRAGEVLGISGLVGAGRSETAMCIFGYDKLDSGSVYVQGKQVNIHSPADAIKLGMALVPEDRKVQGLVQIMDIKGNLVLSVLDSLCKWGYILRDIHGRVDILSSTYLPSLCSLVREKSWVLESQFGLL